MIDDGALPESLTIPAPIQQKSQEKQAPREVIQPDAETVCVNDTRSGRRQNETKLTRILESVFAGETSHEEATVTPTPEAFVNEGDADADADDPELYHIVNRQRYPDANKKSDGSEEPHECDRQYTLDGRPKSSPIPSEFIPEILRIAPWHTYGFEREELEAVVVNTPLPELPEKGYRALAAEEAPYDWVVAACSVLQYVTKYPLEKDEDARSRSVTMRGVIARWFITVTNMTQTNIVNWRTVFYVAHLLRVRPTATCYEIEEDLFSEALGIEEYDLDNWKPRRDYTALLFVVSQLSGDSLNAVATLDLQMRFRRSMTRRQWCTTYCRSENDPGEAHLHDRSYVFVTYMDDDKKRQYDWVEIGLAEEQVSLLKCEWQEEETKGVAHDLFYDGHHCNRCKNHHDRPLSYCNQCYCLMYCSVDCQKADWLAHKKFCKHNKVRK
jgi:MYND finger